MIEPMVFQEILSKEATAVFVQDKESQVASSSNSFVKRDLCLAQGTDAAAAIVIVDRFSAAYAAAALFGFGRMCLDGNGSI